VSWRFRRTRGATLEDLIGQNKALDMGRLQALGEEAQSEDLAYMALVDQEGEILISDQLALVGESAPVVADTRVEEATWRGKAVWVASTPLRRGEDGEQVGTLRMAVRRERIRDVPGRGALAVLAGRADCGTGGRPAGRRPSAGQRRCRWRSWRPGRGASARATSRCASASRGADELATLANAYNQMVTGLQEREWLRDMFGRFVSPGSSRGHPHGAGQAGGREPGGQRALLRHPRLHRALGALPAAGDGRACSTSTCRWW